MKRLYTLLLLVALMGFVRSAFAESSSDIVHSFELGVEAYTDGRYEDALVHFSDIEGRAEGFDLYYNLGNTYYKLNRIPESILYLERALKFNPAHEDASYNLRLANQRIADRIERIPRSNFAVWWEEFKHGTGPNVWAWIAVGFSLLTALLFVAFILGRGAALRRFGFFGSIVALAFFFSALALAKDAYDFRYEERNAIIFADKVDVKSEPREVGTDVFVLHAGTRVELLRKEGEWYRIQIASGKRGWIKAETMQVI